MLNDSNIRRAGVRKFSTVINKKLCRLQQCTCMFPEVLLYGFWLAHS